MAETSHNQPAAGTAGKSGVMQSGSTNRRSFGPYLLTAALLTIAVGLALGSTLATSVGLVLLALVVRYRKNPATWEYFCFIGLALAMGVWSMFTRSEMSPLLSAVPWMLSYVFDYLDERRQKRTASAGTALNAGASQGLEPARSATLPNCDPVADLQRSNATESSSRVGHCEQGAPRPT